MMPLSDLVGLLSALPGPGPSGTSPHALYIGPDQILPLTSWLAGIVGLLLIFWQYVVGLIGRLWRFLLRRK